MFLIVNSSGQASAGFRRVQGEGDSVPEEGVILAVWKSIDSSSGLWNSGEWGIRRHSLAIGVP